MTDALEALLERWTNDTTFRDEYDADPEQAIRSAGLELSDEDWRAIREAKFELTDGLLPARVNKPRVRF
ncbi:MAG: Os1348 family NHLP clan protein [Chloroflexota bacterium]